MCLRRLLWVRVSLVRVDRHAREVYHRGSSDPPPPGALNEFPSGASSISNPMRLDRPMGKGTGESKTRLNRWRGPGVRWLPGPLGPDPLRDCHARRILQSAWAWPQEASTYCVRLRPSLRCDRIHRPRGSLPWHPGLRRRGRLSRGGPLPAPRLQEDGWRSCTKHRLGGLSPRLRPQAADRRSRPRPSCGSPHCSGRRSARWRCHCL